MSTTTPARKWILVADDDPTIRALWVAWLTQAGYRAIPAANGLDVLDLIRSIVPDLLLLDLRMPQISGNEVLEHIAATPVLQRIPIIIISGFLNEEMTPPLGVTLNIVGRVSKPVDPHDVLSAVERVLATSSAMPALGRPTLSIPSPEVSS